LPCGRECPDPGADLSTRPAGRGIVPCWMGRGGRHRRRRIRGLAAPSLPLRLSRFPNPLPRLVLLVSSAGEDRGRADSGPSAASGPGSTVRLAESTRGLRLSGMCCTCTRGLCRPILFQHEWMPPTTLPWYFLVEATRCTEPMRNFQAHHRRHLVVSTFAPLTVSAHTRGKAHTLATIHLG